jgi:hypothetical protein
MRGGVRRQKPRLRVAPILALAAAAFFADAVIAEGRIRQDLTDQTRHLLAAAYEEGRDLGFFW